MKSTINDLDITPPLRFLLWRNVLFSNLFLLSFRFLLPFFLLSSSNVHFHQSIYPLSISSNSFLIFSNILLQTSCHPTHIVPLPYTSLVIPSSCIRLLLSSFLFSPVILLQPLLFQTLQSTLLYSSSSLSFPKYLLPP